jgi:hypothetical protein
MAGPVTGECNVFRHRKGGDGREVLVHHADAQPASVPWRFDGISGPPQPHRTSIRTNQPIRDVHERSLSGAVLAEERMDLALTKRKIGSAQCLHGAESLLDAGQLEDWRHLDQSPVGWS